MSIPYESKNPAIIIGVNTFSDIGVNNELDITKNIGKLSQAISKFFKIDLITDKSASQIVCKSKIDHILNQDHDTVLIYFLGFLYFGESLNKPRDIGWLMPNDSTYESPSILGLNLDIEVFESIEYSKIKNIILILDCYDAHAVKNHKEIDMQRFYNYIEKIISKHSASKKLSILVHCTRNGEGRKDNNVHNRFTKELTDILNTMDKFEIKLISDNLRSVTGMDFKLFSE